MYIELCTKGFRNPVSKALKRNVIECFNKTLGKLLQQCCSLSGKIPMEPLRAAERIATGPNPTIIITIIAIIMSICINTCPVLHNGKISLRFIRVDGSVLKKIDLHVPLWSVERRSRS
jgi:hypothetical protein